MPGPPPGAVKTASALPRAGAVSLDRPPSPLLVRMHPSIRRDLARFGQLDHVQRRASLSGLSVLEAVFSIDGRSIQLGKQPALCLGEMQVDGPRLATGSQKLPDIVHLGVRLVLRWKLLERDQ